MTIKPENEARLILEDTGDLNNAACVITCWAGPDNSADIRIEHVGPSMAFVVDKTWCDSASEPLVFTDGGKDACPLGPAQSIPAGVEMCNAASCKLGPVFTVDQSKNPVSVTVTGPAGAGPFTVYFGTGYLPVTGVKVGDTVKNTYTTPGNYLVRVMDEKTGMFGKPVWVYVTTVPNTITVTCPADQKNKVGDKVTGVKATATGTNPDATPYTFTAAGVPDGVTLSSDGVFSGSPTTEQSAGDVTVTATDKFANTGTCKFSWEVDAGGGNTITVTKPDDQSNAIGDTVSLQLAATDSDPNETTFTWSATGLPHGLSLNTTTGKITGTPDKGQKAGTVTVTAKDSTNASGSTTFKWTVTTSVTVGSVGDQTWTSGTAITKVTLTATDSDTSITSFTWSVSPDLPDGVTLDTATGEITGTPTKAAAQKTYTVTATDSLGASGTKTFKATVSNTVTVAAVDDQTWTAGTAITKVTLSATDSDPSITSFTWSISPALPNGVDLDTATGEITGTPSAATAKKSYTVTATDSTSAAGTKDFNITVSAAAAR